MLVLSHDEVIQALDPHACMQAMRAAMLATSARECVLPLRQFMPIPGRAGKLGLMPGYLGAPDDVFGVKIVSKYERPRGDPYGTHVGAVMLFDAATGLPEALLEGGSLTAIRTSAVTALATQTLARVEARRLLIVGTGEEAWFHLRALCALRRWQQVAVWGRSRERCEALVARAALPQHDREQLRIVAPDDLEAAVRMAEVICTVTSATQPLLRGDWLSPGTHVNLIGSAIPSTAEVDGITVQRARFFVDYREAALAQAGELRQAIHDGLVTEAHIAGELGEVLAGTRPGREHDRQITAYKSLGVTTQDLAAARLAVRTARERGLGRSIDL